MSTKAVLACSECHSRNYTTMKTDSAGSDRLTIKKYCKTCKAHTVHKETK
ncbi:50S ribosomal protein L33 [Salisediminibacterium selenitireducens]|uniref:Large ribosomal subunit protein bL33 n=1 Tax=Bacillus selenitireducens (strain ATCC 700615 / DSM 15326 / MLS10) TaxID=439292 RepID=D6XV89_BACIE|nr:50S ribosomal protein L33 [Salisediminibacterium selenitireducens]ADH97647.1 ribosomal protein L33 [[Bacillus] selenitireducens MLS10]